MQIQPCYGGSLTIYEWRIFIMNLFFRISNNLTAIFVSIIFLINILSRLDLKERKNKIFTIMFILNTSILSVETLTCIINKQPYMWLIPVASILHLILFSSGPIVVYLWCIFVNLWIYDDENLMIKNHNILLLPAIANILLVLTSPFTKAVFNITESNVYERSFLFFMPVATAYFYLAFSYIFIYINKKRLTKIEFLPFMLFGVFPAIGGLVQSLVYGILLIWSSIAFSMIMLYSYLQQQMLQKDYLTGAWSREKLHSHLHRRIRQNNKSIGFSIVFIDLDNFKAINDKLGHNEGDKLLKDLVQIINKILRKGDSITRYGGDEFILFLNVESRSHVETIMERISDSIENYNNTLNHSCKLEFSYGYDLYDFHSNMTVDEYIQYVDELMYKVKRSRKNLLE